MEIIRGRGRTEVKLKADRLGDDLVVCIFNSKSHVGAVSLADYDTGHQTASVSVLARRGHKEDILAQRAAYRICKHLKAAVCVICGIHIDNATRGEIRQIIRNASSAVTSVIARMKQGGGAARESLQSISS